MKSLGIVRERKPLEYRVALLPEQVRLLVQEGCTVFLETGAGKGLSLEDSEYRDAGARVLDTPEDLYAESDLILKVKEPTPEEYGYFREGQMLFCFLHLAANPGLAQFLNETKIQAFAFESIALDTGELPILKPMSQIAGALAVQEGASYLRKDQNGPGLLLSYISEVPPVTVLVLGAGNAGTKSIETAVGMGAQVRVLDRSDSSSLRVHNLFPGIVVEKISEDSLVQGLRLADLVIGTVLIPDKAAPKLIRREHLSVMKPGSVIVDVAVDQGGCAETTEARSHEDPVYVVDGICHYAVSNMPGIVPVTASKALAEALFPYLRELLIRPIEMILAEAGGLSRAFYSP